MIKASLESLLPVYVKLFNFILQFGKMPGTWCQGLITLIYKPGDKSDPTKYRGICVSGCLEKVHRNEQKGVSIAGFPFRLYLPPVSTPAMRKSFNKNNREQVL